MISPLISHNMRAEGIPVEIVSSENKIPHINKASFSEIRPISETNPPKERERTVLKIISVGFKKNLITGNSAHCEYTDPRYPKSATSKGGVAAKANSIVPA